MDEWKYCPWCGEQLRVDQDPALIVRNDDGEIDYEASRKNGFNFEESVKHCEFDIRLWIPDESGDEKIE